MFMITNIDVIIVIMMMMMFMIMMTLRFKVYMKTKLMMNNSMIIMYACNAGLTPFVCFQMSWEMLSIYEILL